MQQSFCDGLSVNYSSPRNSTSDPRRNCATQSTGGSTDLTHIDTYYIPSPPLQVAETGQQSLPQHQSPNLFPPTINTSIQAYQYSHSHPSQGIWATPPSTACEAEDFDGCSFHGSPTGGSCGNPPVAPRSAHSSAASPGSWSPSEAQQMNFQPAFIKEQDHMQQYNFRNCGPMQFEQVRNQMASSSPYENASFVGASTGLDAENAARQQVPTAVSDLPDSDPAVVSQDGPSRSGRGLKAPFDAGEGEVPPQPAPAEQQNNEEGGKSDEPYAQLIHRAFMSREPHAMTLQELYQWFRENTEKAKGENKGWQNSIRHNLSMNHAFVKRERKPSPGDPLTESGEAKKSTEWVLEDWAVHGVQSTTRYRSKGTSNRRGGAPGSHARAQSNLSGRANSGRKGGLCASKSKAAATRRAVLNRHHASVIAGATSSPHDSGRHQLHQSRGMIFGHPIEFQYPVTNVRAEPITPPDPVAGDVMLGGPLHHAAGLQAADANHGFPYANNLQYGQNHSQQHHHNHSYHPASGFYTLEDVTGIYQNQPAPGPSQATHDQSAIHSGLGTLFPDVADIRENRVSFPYWHESANGAPYQP
ncbi:hypothetical protein AAE478_009746 [Parahypoxylon ruwenzoriense]